MMDPTMEKTLSGQASDWREGRRLRAFELKERGWKQTEIADALGVTEGAVSQWMKRAREEGVEGLRHKPPPGATSRLSEEERAELPELLAQGAEAHGFRGSVWTCERVAEMIRKEFGVLYHPAHVSRLVGKLGLSLQKPVRRANQRDEEAIERWKEERWPHLKKALERGQDHSVCRSVRLLPVAYGSAHLRPSGKDAHSQGESQPRSSFGDERHHPRRQALHVRAGASLQGRGRGALSKAPDAPNPWQDASHMGWLSDTSRRSGKGISGKWGGCSIAARTTTRLCSRSQPRRGSLEAPQVCGIEEPLLPEPLRVEGRATKGQGAIETQKRCHPRLYKAARI